MTYVNIMGIPTHRKFIIIIIGPTHLLTYIHIFSCPQADVEEGAQHASGARGHHVAAPEPTTRSVLHIYIYIYLCVFIYIYVYIYIYIYIYTYVLHMSRMYDVHRYF